MSGLYDPINQRLIYPTSSTRKKYRNGSLVVSIDPNRLTSNWQQKMQAILNIYDIPLFHSFIKDGYTTRYLEGCTDLHGNIPFCAAISDKTILTETQREKVKSLLVDIQNVGKKLGFTFGDITCSNILLKEDDLYLIDYEVIVDYPLNESYQRVWENTIRLLFLTD
jgi:thiamine kinase-like enzyme